MTEGFYCEEFTENDMFLTGLAQLYFYLFDTLAMPRFIQMKALWYEATKQDSVYDT